MFLEGRFYEFIAFPCMHRYSMPLGILWSSPPLFRVYKSTGLHSILEGYDGHLYLLSPIRPEYFWYSVQHELEEMVEWRGCPVPDDVHGAWFKCKPVKATDSDYFTVFECRGFRHVSGEPPPYSRSYGCLVELIVLYTKIRAGVDLDGVGDYIRWLEWCIKRSAPGGGLDDLSDSIIGMIHDMLAGGRGGE